MYMHMNSFIICGEAHVFVFGQAIFLTGCCHFSEARASSYWLALSRCLSLTLALSPPHPLPRSSCVQAKFVL